MLEPNAPDPTTTTSARDSGAMAGNRRARPGGPDGLDGWRGQGSRPGVAGEGIRLAGGQRVGASGGPGTGLAGAVARSDAHGVGVNLFDLDVLVNADRRRGSCRVRGVLPIEDDIVGGEGLTVMPLCDGPGCLDSFRGGIS